MNNKIIITGILLITAVFGLAYAPAGEQGRGSKLNYFEGTYGEAQELAKKEDKIIFMDCYTDWCGWCKELDKRTFSNQELADYMNSHFVILKMDMESDAGLVLGKKFRVRGYPTLLFIDHSENVSHRVDGFLPAGQMLEEAQMAQGKFENSK